MSPEQIGNAVEERRRELGLTVTALAVAVGVTKETLAALRLGTGRVPMDATVIGIARAFKWPNDWYQRMVGDRWPPDQEPELEPPMTRPGETRIQVDAADGARLIEIPADELRRMRELIDQLLGDSRHD